MTSIIAMMVLVAIAVVGLVASAGGADGGGGARLNRSTRRRLGRAKREFNDSILNRRGARR